ncbi:unnamed protein product, partial [Tetraodon nigroviridis]
LANMEQREKTESMLVVTAEDEDSAPSRDVSRHFEDPSYGYTEFSRRGEQVPTFTLRRTTAGRTTASHWSTSCTPTWDRCWTRSSSWPTTSPTTPWPHTRTWTPACCAGPSGTTSTACSASATTTTITGRSTSSWTVASRSTSRQWCAVQRRPPNECYTEFSRRGEQDYTWEDHGFSLVNRLYPDVGQTGRGGREEENEGKSTQRQEGPGEEQPQAPNCIKAAPTQPMFRPSPGCFL